MLFHHLTCGYVVDMNVDFESLDNFDYHSALLIESKSHIMAKCSVNTWGVEHAAFIQTPYGEGREG